MAEKVRCEICNRNFKNQESLDMHNAAKHSISREERRTEPISKKSKKWMIWIFVTAIAIIGIIWAFSGIKTLPPTDLQGHVEANPPSHILKEPMPIAIQKHMLEHVDGVEGGRGGVIINYNCKDYQCEENLIGNLEAFATKYDYVYVSPLENMDAKIAITKLGKIEILENYNEEKIESFII